MTYYYSPDVIKLNPQLAGQPTTVSASKYHNAKTEACGMKFDSGKEASGVANLILLEEQKVIFSLRLQVHIPLQAKITYIADAVYLDQALQVHVVDFKGFKTKEYRMKKKLFKEKYGKDIEEV
jgi:hypothetical protein